MELDTSVSSKHQKRLLQVNVFDHIHEVIQEIRLDFQTQGSKSLLMAEAKSIYEKAIFICYELYQKTKESKWIDKAFIFSEASRAILLLESRKQQRALAESQIPDSLRQEEASICLLYTSPSPRD